MFMNANVAAVAVSVLILSLLLPPRQFTLAFISTPKILRLAPYTHKRRHKSSGRVSRSVVISISGSKNINNFSCLLQNGKHVPSPFAGSHSVTARQGTKLSSDGVIDKKDRARSRKRLVWGGSILTIGLLALWKREILLSLITSTKPTTDRFKAWIVTMLDDLNSLGTPGLIIYSLSLLIWEVTVGITTPVETAAGMAFGIKKGILANALGKISGSLLAYFLGKYLLQDYVKTKLRDNETMELVEDSFKSNPVGVALIWRFSPLPEFVKNFGLSVVPALKPIHFVSAVFLHGFPFTCLWTCLGAETGMLVRGVVAEPSRTLKVLVSAIPWFGFFVSPTLVALWIKGLKKKQNQRKNA